MRSRFLVGLALAATLSAAEMVLVPVTVADGKGRPVEGLQSSDFVLLDNGRRREIVAASIDTRAAPIALAIAVQSSGISLPVLDKVMGIGPMIQPLITGERGVAAVLSFAERVEWLQDFTSDPDVIEQAFYKLRPGEDKEARMLDAASLAIDRLRRRPGVRRVLLLISESRDRSSETVLEAVAGAAQSAGVAVYAITFSAIRSAFVSQAPVGRYERQRPKSPSEVTGTFNGAPASPHNPKTMAPEHRVDIVAGMTELMRLGLTNTTEALAQVTGGRTFSFARQRSLEEAIRKLGVELHSQYVLGFVPEKSGAESGAGVHTLEVRLKRPGRFQVRARPAYLPQGQ